MIPCHKCGKAMATNHVTVITGFSFLESHYCDGCASGDAPSTPPAITRCDRCGSALHDIQARGRLGCANDYRIFFNDLSECIQRYHGSTQHKGKVPKTARGFF